MGSRNWLGVGRGRPGRAGHGQLGEVNHSGLYRLELCLASVPRPHRSNLLVQVAWPPLCTTEPTGTHLNVISRLPTRRPPLQRALCQHTLGPRSEPVPSLRSLLDAFSSHPWKAYQLRDAVPLKPSSAAQDGDLARYSQETTPAGEGYTLDPEDKDRAEQELKGFKVRLLVVKRVTRLPWPTGRINTRSWGRSGGVVYGQG